MAQLAAVAVRRLRNASYPTSAPFHPGLVHPEYVFGSSDIADSENGVYEGVRDLLRMLAFDSGHFGTSSWNPFGEIVDPGDLVVVKPNLICQANWADPTSWEEVVTHPLLIRAVVDFLLIALQGKGRIVIADGPQTDSDFSALVARTGMDELIRFYESRGAPVELLDLRQERWIALDGITTNKVPLPGDPRGYVSVDLGAESAFHNYQLNGRYYGADYDVEETRRFHAGGRHEYILCGTPMAADVLINLPKMKTHKKTGVTLSLKNLVGINGHRNCLPHFTIGTPSQGGDESPDEGLSRRVESGALATFRRAVTATGGTGGAWARLVKRIGRAVFGDTEYVIRSGNWSGNDTAWRMVLDLNQALLWRDEYGARRSRRKKYFSIIDGVVGGEGNGPLAPTPLASGLLVAGANPWQVDRVAASEMGLDPTRIPLLARPLQSPDHYAWLIEDGEYAVIVEGERAPTWKPYTPHFGWRVISPVEGARQQSRASEPVL